MAAALPPICREMNAFTPFRSRRSLKFPPFNFDVNMRPARFEEVFCLKCRRYVGTFERCPYCGAGVPKRLSFRLLKWGGLTVAILGVLLLYADLHGPRLIVREPPTIAIGDISPAMNFAQVYLTGDATFVRYDEETKFLGMFLSDENGNEIFIRAYDSETRRLIEMEKRRIAENDPQPKFPAVGDRLKVRGNLRVRPGFRMMIMQFAEGLTIERPEATPISIENLVENAGTFREYQRFEVEGKVIDVDNRGWSVILTVYEVETKAEISVLIPKVVFLFGRSLEAGIGDTIRVSGAFSMYLDTPQLWLASWDDLEVKR